MSSMRDPTGLRWRWADALGSGLYGAHPTGGAIKKKPRTGRGSNHGDSDANSGL
jgi:hypothetical protein